MGIKLFGCLRTIVIALALAALALQDERARAAEGAASMYFPGAYGNFAVAATPAPGFYLQNDVFYYSGDVDAAVLSGRVNAALDLNLVVNLTTLLWVPDVKILGAQYAAAAFVPFGYGDLDASVSLGPLAVSRNFDRFDIGDAAIVPASLYWSFGNLNLNLYEVVGLPTGGYSTNRTLNIGRNYFAFDTVLAATLTIPELSAELNVVPGIMVNTKNQSTNYKTGTEFHMDWMANYYPAQTFALGVHGYVYQQLEGDSGSGARLGDFKGEAAAIGPALMWVPIINGKPGKVVVKWLHEFHAKRRVKGDFLQVQGVIPF